MHSFKTIRSAQSQEVSRYIFALGLLLGLSFFAYYYAHHLTTAHYDAKAHLLVARRVTDAISPGYSQLGVNWLPLIHLIYLPIVMLESQYRSGVIPSLISVLAFAVSGRLAYKISYRFTGSIAAGFFAAILILANPNLLYLQSCPLTEPLYMALLLLATDSLVRWREDGRPDSLPWLASIWTCLGALCRYEGFYFFVGVLFLLLLDFGMRYLPRRKALRGAAVFCLFTGITVVAHFGYMYFRLGDTFFGRVAQGHPAPYMTYKRPFLSLVFHLAELSQISTFLPLLLAAAGVFVLIAQREEFKRRIPMFLLWLPSLINISALYWGLIYRVRYSVLLLPAVAVFASLVITSGAAKRRSFLLILAAILSFPWITWFVHNRHPGDAPMPGPGALVLPIVALVLFLIARVRQWYGIALLSVCVLGMQIPPLARENRPMIVETLEHEFIEPERQAVLQYLKQNYDGKRILIDMGTEAPLVYDSGLDVKEFIYNEGGERLWHEAGRNLPELTGWLCFQKGDGVWQLLASNADFMNHYALVLKTEHYSLYQRNH
jgi:hypothetical protein